MTTSKKIAALIVIFITALPMLMVANDGSDALPNFLGIAYSYLYFKYGALLAPKFVKDYLAIWDARVKNLD